MNRRSIHINAGALSGADTFVCASVRMAVDLRGAMFTVADSRSPGEGDDASP